MSNIEPTEIARGRWWREPLLHFAVIGALLFAADYALVAREDDPTTIVVDAAVVAEAKKVFRDSRNRDPEPDELAALTRRWIDNEILFREGMALGVDQGDDAIRERVIFKSLMLLETGLKLPPVDDAKLRSWFETQRAKYDEPARYDFQEAVLTDDNSEQGSRAFAELLNTGTPGEAKAGLRVFKGRPHANLVQSYGADFAKALESGEVGSWRALQTPDGWRVMRLDAITPARAAVFENVRNVVLQDWTDATMAEMRTQAVRERGQKYKLKFEQGAT
ncbi:MAG TPA: peptidylprolyl isomerase [Rubrivivax sp.]|nr:peptidylprolyl isomerase [Rubrivivax sp.]